MPFDLGMEVSNITNKQQYGEECCFRESKKAKVLNKALGNIQKTKKEKSCLSLDSEKQTDPTEQNGNTGVIASLDFLQCGLNNYWILGFSVTRQSSLDYPDYSL